MSRRARSSRFTAWAVVFLLVLRAAVPLFAVSAAQARGVPVGEVCDVYGVALRSASHGAHAAHAALHGAHAEGAHGDGVHGAGVHGDAAHHAGSHGDAAHGDGAHGDAAHGHGAHGDAARGHGAHGDSAHGGNHCALTALGSLALPDAAATWGIGAGAATQHGAPAPCVAVHDACAAWAARLQHGPPVLA